MYEVKKISEKYSEKSKKRDDQKGFDQDCHRGAETFTFCHSVDHCKNKQQQRCGKQNCMHGLNYAPLPLLNLPHHFIIPLISPLALN
jgi:hypothetical protein